jgi:hypothetical protein
METGQATLQNRVVDFGSSIKPDHEVCRMFAYDADRVVVGAETWAINYNIRTDVKTYKDRHHVASFMPQFLPPCLIKNQRACELHIAG